jgi:hypothetical protein
LASNGNGNPVRLGGNCCAGGSQPGPCRRNPIAERDGAGVRVVEHLGRGEIGKFMELVESRLVETLGQREEGRTAAVLSGRQSGTAEQEHFAVAASDSVFHRGNVRNARRTGDE